MRAIDADAIVVHKFPSEDYDPSENDAEKAYRKGWNDALDAVAEFQPSAEPEETLEEAEEGIDAAFKKLRDARVTVLPSAEPEVVRCKECMYYDLFPNGANGTCEKHIDAMAVFYPWDFCSYAERRTDESN